MIPEDSEVIADLDPLVAPEVYVYRAEFTVRLAVVFSYHQHCHRLAAHRRKMIEGGRIFVWRCRTILIRLEDIPALHVIAREYDLSDRNLWLNVYHPDLSRVHIGRAHGFHELRLPLEPWHVRGVLVRPHNREPVTDANTLVLAAIDVHVVAARKGDLVV